MDNTYKFTKQVCQALEARDPSTLLFSVRKSKALLGWKGVDLFLFNEDLGEFFFPKGTSGEPDEFLREFVKSLDPKDIFSYPNPADRMAQLIKDRFDFNFRIFPLEIENQKVGFTFFLYPSKEIPSDDTCERMITRVCNLVLYSHMREFHFERFILENETLKNRLVRAENLKLLGEMVGGITHDFNNLLAGIIGFCQLIQLDVEDEEILESLDDILQAANQAKKLIAFISATKKVDLKEAERKVSISSIAKRACEHIRSYLHQYISPDKADEFFDFACDPFMSVFNLPEALLEEVFLQVYAGFIKNGADGIGVRIKNAEGSVEVRIYPKSIKKDGKIPLSLESSEDFPTFLVLHYLRSVLNFNFELTKGEVILRFFPKKFAEKLKVFPALANKSIFVFEPDRNIAKLYRKLFEKIEAKYEVVERIEKVASAIDDLSQYDIVILDVSASSLLIEKKVPLDTIVFSTSWGGFLDMNFLRKYKVKRILPKPFTLDYFVDILNK